MKKYISLLTTILCCLFFSTLLLTGQSYKYTAFILAIIALFSLHKTYPALQNRDVKILILSLTGFFLTHLFSLIITGGKISELDLPSRTIFASLILLLLCTYKPKPQWIMASIPIGSSIAGILAITHVMLYGGRAFFIGTNYMVIQAGGMAMYLSILSLISFFYYQHKKYYYLSTFSFLSSFLGLSGSLLSGVRGAWLLSPFILLWIVWSQRHLLNRRIILATILAFGMVMVVSYPQVQTRISSTTTELTGYAAHEKSSSERPSGARLEMWKSAIYSTLEKPIFGQGYLALKKAKEKQVEQGLVDNVVLKYSGAHNQFFQEMQTKGLLGLVGLLFLFAVPYRFFNNYQKNTVYRSSHYYFTLMGKVHILLIMGFCLTQHYLSHHSGIILYSIGVVIFASLVTPKKI
ncbi:MAG: O-antigen ligase [Moritella dasanensis]|jgi:O-antigen ligase